MSSEETLRVTIEEWDAWRTSHAVLPFVVSFPDSPFPSAWDPWWRETRHSALLETGKAGRYTIFVPRIKRFVEGRASGLRELDAAGACRSEIEGDPVDALRKWLAARRAPNPPSIPFFHGGLVGLFSYDFARALEQLPEIARADIDFPLYHFGLSEEGYVYDHAESTLHCFVSCPASDVPDEKTLKQQYEHKAKRARELREEWETIAHQTAPPTPHTPIRQNFNEENFSASFDQESFVRAVHRVQEYIAAGDTYQVNLSVRRSRPLKASPERVYEHLRTINPSPYMALLRSPERSVVCGSPELLIRLYDGKLEARPIAGTRPRGETNDEDTSLTRELLVNEKERAEHLMLVDLIRNDLGRVSRYGTVQVSEFMSVENYSHVMHIVSHILGQLAPGKDAIDAIAAAFPGGTITGAPKVRTMEIIEELEPYRRGPYTGSIGWLGFDGNFELNIIIRTMLVEAGTAHVQAGAGIVADSIPEKEYEESLNKAKALWAAAFAAEAEGRHRTDSAVK